MATSLKRSKGSQSSLRIGTFSFWMKVCSLGNNLVMYSNTVENDNNRGYIQLTTDGKLRMVDNDSSGDHIVLRTNRVFRDFNAWYHFVIRVDTTQSTNTDRVRFYINGVQETSLDETTYPAQNTDLKIFEGGQTNREYINRVYGGSAYADNFILSHYHYTDGQSYGPDTFGSTDATTGEWKINPNPTVTYGNQGFFMFKNDASLNDDSGNGNNWTADSGTIQKTEDNPSNVFCTLNPLYPYTSTGAFTNGNTVPSDYATYQSIVGTLGASSGKYYFEVKINGSSGEIGMIGWGARDTGQITYPGGAAYDWARYNNTTSYYNNATDTQISGSSAYTTGDICGCAIDLDNNKIYWYKNGALENTGGTTITASSTAGNYFPIVRNGQGNNIQCNFGNGYFGTTAVSSAGTNASNLGIFEYDVPSGYTALCTKGLNL